MITPLVSTRNLERVFTIGSERIRALYNINLEVFPGQLMVITGRSGSGKTTFLNLLAGLDRATSGTIHFQNQDLSELAEWDLTQLRRHNIGFVFQSFGLLTLLSAYENIELPLRIAEWGRRERQKRTEECLRLVGLADRAGHRPYELSGGEQQRVAIARAIVHRPSLIFADEPTGELDSVTGAAVFSLLKKIVDKEDVTVIAVTHDIAMAEEMATSTMELSDGSLDSNKED